VDSASGDQNGGSVFKKCKRCFEEGFGSSRWNPECLERPLVCAKVNHVNQIDPDVPMSDQASRTAVRKAAGLAGLQG